MVSKAGYLKESKNVGHILQNIGQTGADFFDNSASSAIFAIKSALFILLITSYKIFIAI